MFQSKPVNTSLPGHVAPMQHIIESLQLYKGSARLDVPKTAIAYMDAMCTIAKRVNSGVADLLQSHVEKRKKPKSSPARYRFGAALEAHARHLQTTAHQSGSPGAMRQNLASANNCLLRAERNILAGYLRDPHHVHADRYFAAHPEAARCTLSNLASRLTMASLHKPRLPPLVCAPATRADMPMPTVAAPGSARKRRADTAGLMLPPPPGPIGGTRTRARQNCAGNLEPGQAGTVIPAGRFDARGSDEPLTYATPR